MGKSISKIALGLGLIAGAITGALFAPSDGKTTRKNIAKGDTKAIKKDLKAMGEEILTMVAALPNQPLVKDAVNSAKNKAAEMGQMDRKELDELLKKATEKAEAFKGKVAEFVKEQKAALDAELKMSGKSAPQKTPKKRRVAKKVPAKVTPKKKK